MKQLLQNLKDGRTTLDEVPYPAASHTNLVVRARASVISAGTERMLLDFGKANWIEKARQQPDKVRMVLDKITTDGLLPTIESVRAKLDQPIPLGYSNSGVVLGTGPGVTEFNLGDRVVSNGAHAEIVSVPKNLCAKIPDGVSDDAAAFTVVGAIGLQGVRLIQPTLGECIVVTGLGLLGLITVQLLRAHGCRVLGIDFDPHKLRLAEQFGAETVNLSAGEDPIVAAERFSRGRGVDAVLITAATKSNEPVHQAALMCRKRGRIVLVGVTGLQLSRDDFYKKELSFQVSCSYGPGRYDSNFEHGGHDYPYPYVRWTAQRNFEAVLDMLADGRLNIEPLITHRFAFEQAERAYELIQSKERYLGIVLEYASETQRPAAQLLAGTIALPAAAKALPASGRIGCIGAGGYATKILIPAFRDAGAGLDVIVSNGGVSAAHAGRKFGFRQASTDPDRVFTDGNIDTVVIATRHDSHAGYVCRALQSGKNVFVEKPLALTAEQVDDVEQEYTAAIRRGGAPRVMVGFNRRFAPHVAKMKVLLAGVREPKAIVITVNAGHIPSDHWTQDSAVGGGRILGEACHFVDLARFLAGSKIASVQSVRAAGPVGPSPDTISFTMAFQDGSVATVHYFATGHKAFPKERVEVFCAGRILQLDNFRSLKAFGWPHFHGVKLWRQNKGAKETAAAFLRAVRTGSPSPIPFEEILEVSRFTIRIANS